MHFAHGSDSPKEQAPLRQKNLALVQALNEDHPKKILHLLNDCETNGRFLPETKPTGLVEAMTVLDFHLRFITISVFHHVS